jgi:alkaline phosphatase D
MAQYRVKQSGADAFSTDDWDGYPANRTRLLKRIQQSQVSNPVVIGGDIHSFFANDLKLDFDNPASPVIATEFVGTSISSYGVPYEVIAPALPDNPHVHFFESRRRGYVCVDLERAQMQVRMRVVSDAADPKADISTLKTLAVEGGLPARWRLRPPVPFLYRRRSLRPLLDQKHRRSAAAPRQQSSRRRRRR